jgi:predicted DNA-binding transcriptional regulator YafY
MKYYIYVIMKKSSLTEFARRINFAVGVLSAGKTQSAARQALVRKFAISERQAFRYLKTAENTPEPLAVPERKLVFTVKLPIGLIQRIRREARMSTRTLSDLVAEALGVFLKMGEKSGKKAKRTPSRV